MVSKFARDQATLDLADLTEGTLDPFRDTITWTGHAWTNLVKDDPKLLIACSLEGHVLIVKALNGEVIDCWRSETELDIVDDYQEPVYDRFVSVATCQLGFVLATE